jgi:hypothetical protein
LKNFSWKPLFAGLRRDSRPPPENHDDRQQRPKRVIHRANVRQFAHLQSPAAIKGLLNAGSDATLKNKPGSTAFHLAVQNTGRGGRGSEKAKTAQREIIHAFLDRGVSPGHEDGKGKSVLEWTKSDWIRQLLAGNGERRNGKARGERITTSKHK